MDSQQTARQPHADLDIAARKGKARKIRRLLAGRVPLRGARILEIGTGSGVIAAALAEDAGQEGEVWGVDVVDQRRDAPGVKFQQVSDPTLPFDDASFDLVLSNHVIEHVGDLPAQHRHINEVARVLKPGACFYLAMPNRWAVVEPHFKLPLLSWLPEASRSSYVRLTARGDVYDCSPMSRRQLVALLDRHGFIHEELTREAARLMGEVEDVRVATRALLTCAPILLTLGRPIVPTLVFLARKPPAV